MNTIQDAARKGREAYYDRDSRGSEAHAFKNVMAAWRLLSGAFAARELSDEVFKKCLEEFTQLEPVGVDPERCLQDHKAFRAELRVETGPSLSGTLGTSGLHDKKLLVVDDQARSAGWSILFHALIPDQFEFALSKNEAEQVIGQRSSDFACVLLDLQLPVTADATPDSADVGVSLLEWIKSQDISLPIVVFSGVDEVRYARRCFEAGADDFFVKELEEDNKSYIDYFRRFKRSIVGAVAHPEQRQLWCRIRQLPRPAQGETGSVLFRAVEADLRRAYFFLTSDPKQIRARLVFTNPGQSTIYDECVLQCGKAVERVVSYHIRKLDKKRAKRLEARFHGLPGFSTPRHYSRLALSSETAESQLKVLQDEGLLDGTSVDLASSVWRGRNRAAHAGAPQRIQPSFQHEGAVAILKQSLEFVKRYFASERSSAPTESGTRDD